MADKKEEKNIADHHRQMFAMSGKLSSFQLKNLQAFPQIAFDDLDMKKCKIDYDFYETTTNEDGEEVEVLCAGSVTYTLYTAQPIEKDENNEKRVQDLVTWVKFLFWKDTDVEVVMNGEKWI